MNTDYRYDDHYSWAHKESDGTYTVGITKKSADENEAFVFIQLPERGARIANGATYVSLESVKSTGHVPSPLSGEVIDVNDTLFDDPSLINQDPYGSWIMRLKVDDDAEYDALNTEPPEAP